MNCPNCGNRNSKEAAFCAKCGFRLPTAAARGAGIAYRRTQQAEPLGGGGQGMLAFGVVLLAGLLFAGGALALFLSAPAGPSPTPTRVADGTPVSSLPIFVQPTPTPSPEPTPSPIQSVFFTPTPSGFIESPPPSIPVPTPTPTFIFPTPTPTNPPPTSTPTPTPTPTVAPVYCAVVANGSNPKTKTLGYGNATAYGPTPKTWCVHAIIVRPYDGNGSNKYGVYRLLRDTRVVAQYHCDPNGTCDAESVIPFDPARRWKSGSTLTYQFSCEDNPATVGDDCADLFPDGGTIEIDYEPFAP